MPYRMCFHTECDDIQRIVVKLVVVIRRIVKRSLLFIRRVVIRRLVIRRVVSLIEFAQVVVIRRFVIWSGQL